MHMTVYVHVDIYIHLSVHIHIHSDTYRNNTHGGRGVGREYYSAPSRPDIVIPAPYVHYECCTYAQPYKLFFINVFMLLLQLHSSIYIISFIALYLYFNSVYPIYFAAIFEFLIIFEIFDLVA
jgi:hypothetical protein